MYRTDIGKRKSTQTCVNCHHEWGSYAQTDLAAQSQHKKFCTAIKKQAKQEQAIEPCDEHFEQASYAYSEEGSYSEQDLYPKHKMNIDIFHNNSSQQNSSSSNSSNNCSPSYVDDSLLAELSRRHKDSCRLVPSSVNTRAGKSLCFNPLTVPEKYEILMTAGFKGVPDFQILELERFHDAVTEHLNAYTFNKINGVNVDQRDCITINKIANDFGLSMAETDQLIDYIFKEIIPRHFGDEKSVVVPRFKAIKKKLQAFWDQSLPVQKFVYRFPQKYLMLNPEAEPDLKPVIAVGWYSPFNNLVAQVFSDSKPGDFEWEPCPKNMEKRKNLVQVDNPSMNLVYTNFMSGDACVEQNERIRKDHGPLAKILYLAVYHDESVLNSSMTRTANGLYVYFLNSKPGTSAGKYHLLGYFPNNFSMTAKDIWERLLPKEFSEILKKSIIHVVDRQLNRAFIYECLSPLFDFKVLILLLFLKIVLLFLKIGSSIVRLFYECLSTLLDYKESGVVVALGSVPNINSLPSERLVHLYFVLISFFSDEPAKNKISGPNYMAGVSMCTICTSPSCLCDEVGISYAFRDDKKYNELAILLETVMMDDIVCALSKLPRTKDEKIARKFFVNSMKLLGVAPGDNILHRFFEDNLSGYSFFDSQRVDYLHVWLKGFIEKLICIVCQIFVLCGKLDASYRNNMAILDQRLASYQKIQTQHISKHVNFPNGVQKVVDPTLKTKKKTTANAMQSIGLEGWKLPSLLIQILFAIGVDGNLLPNTEDWYLRYVLRNKHQVHIDSEIAINISKTCISAISAVLEVTFSFSGTSISSEQLKDLELKICNSRVHFEKVSRLLRRVSLLGEDPANIIKSHNPTHYPRQITWVGFDKRAWDCEDGEHQHILMKELDRKTSKKCVVESKQLILRNNEMIHGTRLYNQFVKPCESNTPASISSSHSPLYDFVVSSTFGKQEVVVKGLTIEPIVSTERLFIHPSLSATFGTTSEIVLYRLMMNSISHFPEILQQMISNVISGKCLLIIKASIFVIWLIL
jgi:hypothetical protein